MVSEPVILSVETATLAGSVALSRGETILGVISGDAGISHSNTLLRDIDKLLEEKKIELREIDLFAVATGPGSFTGLRIGIATVKALAATLDRPCSGIPTLEAIALSGGVSEATVAMLPAGRGEIFAQLFSVSDSKEIKALGEAAHIPPEKLFERFGHIERVIWCGEGAVAHRKLIEDWGEAKHWEIASQTGDVATHVALLALSEFRQSHIEDPAALRAVYVRPADAELKIQ